MDSCIWSISIWLACFSSCEMPDSLALAISSCWARLVWFATSSSVASAVAVM